MYKFDTLLPFVILAILAGPAMSGIIMTILTGGINGLKEQKTHFMKRNVRRKWYVTSLLMGPLIMAAIYLILSLFLDKFIPGIL